MVTETSLEESAPLNTARGLILVVDDEPAICWAFERMLRADGHTVVSVSSAEHALDYMRECKADLVLLDVRLPDEDGISALPKFLAVSPDTPIIVMTAFGDLETAVSAIEKGAADYLTKPFGLDEVQRACNSALAARLTQAVTTERKRPAPKDESVPALIGSSTAMQRVFRQIALVAGSDLSVLITGETGTGKELVAAAIHRHSQRSKKPYVPVAPVALNAEIIESELFGHAQGAFTGAQHDRQGIFERANGGTVLLDEIGELPLGIQVKLLRVLDQQEYFRVGDVTPRKCDVRILAATNCDLQQAVAAGTFREDLYYRLNGLRLHLPPLRERSGDIRPLCDFFLERLRYPVTHAVSDSLAAHLGSRPWHGNVRELRNAVEQAAVVARGRALQIDDFPEPQAAKHSASTDHGDALAQLLTIWWDERMNGAPDSAQNLYAQFVDEIEPTLLRLAMQQAQGNRSKAADLLGIHRGTLREKLKASGLD